MKIIFSKKQKSMLATVQRLNRLNRRISDIVEAINDAIIYNDVTGRITAEHEKRQLVNLRNEILESLKK